MQDQQSGQGTSAAYGPPPQAYGQAAPTWTCEACGFVGFPQRTKEMSPLAWMVFVILIFLCIVLCWIPFVSMKRDMEICPRCGHNHVRGIRKKG